MKKILVTGATGLIGTHFIRRYYRHAEISVLSHRPKHAKKRFPKCAVYDWSAINRAGFIDGFDVVINLAGENIANHRWSKKRCARIIGSRVQTTQVLVNAILSSKSPPRLLNASAIGIYGYTDLVSQQMTQTYDEYSELPDMHRSFSTYVVQSWEHEIVPLASHEHSYAILRFGVVLSKEGGMLSKLRRIYRMGLGGRVGSGKQPISWVSIEDAVRAIAFLIEHSHLNGVINVVAPEVLAQQSFAKKLAAILHRPCYFPLPSFLVRLLYGKMGEELLLNGQYVKPTVLVRHGFKFKYPLLKGALKHELSL